jgi:hypothetical protein
MAEPLPVDPVDEEPVPPAAKIWISTLKRSMS